MNAAMTSGWVLLILGLLVMFFKYLDERRRSKAMGVDPVAGIGTVAELIKKYGIGVVLAAAGIVLIVLGAFQGDDDKDTDNNGGTPVAHGIVVIVE